MRDLRLSVLDLSFNDIRKFPNIIELSTIRELLLHGNFEIEVDAYIYETIKLKETLFEFIGPSWIDKLKYVATFYPKGVIKFDVFGTKHLDNKCTKSIYKNMVPVETCTTSV